ncbi:MAG: hypothetical protein ABII01_05490 [Candidatus Woesearchaeota archaeon]
MESLIALELILEAVLIVGIAITIIKALARVAPSPNVKHEDLMKGIWKLEIAVGFALCGLAGFTISTILASPKIYGPILMVITLGVATLTFQAKVELDRVRLIQTYSKKINAWADKYLKKDNNKRKN